jgi:hypothetical protein
MEPVGHVSTLVEEIKELRAQLVLRKSQLFDAREDILALKKKTLGIKDSEIVLLTSRISKNTDLTLANE